MDSGGWDPPLPLDLGVFSLSLRPGCLFLNQSYSDDRILFLNLKFSNCTYLHISTSCFSSNKSLFLFPVEESALIVVSTRRVMTA